MSNETNLSSERRILGLLWNWKRGDKVLTLRKPQEICLRRNAFEKIERVYSESKRRARFADTSPSHHPRCPSLAHLHLLLTTRAVRPRASSSSSISQFLLTRRIVFSLSLLCASRALALQPSNRGQPSILYLDLLEAVPATGQTSSGDLHVDSLALGCLPLFDLF